MEKIIKLRGSNSRICGISGGLFEGGAFLMGANSRIYGSGVNIGAQSQQQIKVAKRHYIRSTTINFIASNMGKLSKFCMQQVEDN